MFLTYKNNLSFLGVTVKISNTEPWSVIIVTKVMQRVQKLANSREMLFVDSTCSCESTATSLTVILTATKVGALPLAVLMHPTQTFENYASAFTLLKENFPKCFGGQEVSFVCNLYLFKVILVKYSI